MRPLHDYREFLRLELAERCKARPQYSLRAFARDLAIPPQRLSDILNGKQGLSIETGEKIARKLSLKPAEKEFFCTAIQSKHGRSLAKRSEAIKHLARLESTQPNYGLGLGIDAFNIIADWFHYGIMELTRVVGFKSDPEWIARRLGLSPRAVEPAIERLKRLEILEELPDGKLSPTEHFISHLPNVPSDALKKFHQQILKKAEAAVTLQTIEQRDLSAVVMAIDSSRIDEARAEIKKFRRKFSAQLENGGTKNSVYCLSIQFFELTENLKEEEK